VSSDDALRSVVAHSPRPIVVTGDGALARRLRDVVGAGVGAPSDGVRPGTVVETTGAVEEVARALSTVADLGMVVLVGPPPASGAALDLHDDLHVRGITLVGLEPLSS